MKTILIALALILSLPAATFADVDCSDVKSKNRDECVRAKRNRGDNDRDDINRGDVNRGNRGGVNCSNAKDKNRAECAEAKFNLRNEDVDKDDVKCRNANDPDVRRECLKRKY